MTTSWNPTKTLLYAGAFALGAYALYKAFENETPAPPQRINSGARQALQALTDHESTPEEEQRWIAYRQTVVLAHCPSTWRNLVKVEGEKILTFLSNPYFAYEENLDFEILWFPQKIEDPRFLSGVAVKYKAVFTQMEQALSKEGEKLIRTDRYEKLKSALDNLPPRSFAIGLANTNMQTLFALSEEFPELLELARDCWTEVLLNEAVSAEKQAIIAQKTTKHVQSQLPQADREGKILPTQLDQVQDLREEQNDLLASPPGANLVGSENLLV